MSECISNNSYNSNEIRCRPKFTFSKISSKPISFQSKEDLNKYKKEILTNKKE